MRLYGFKPWAVVTMMLTSCGGASPHSDLLPSVEQADALQQVCPVDGVWGVRFVVPVSWPRTAAVSAGEGELVQYARAQRQRTQDGFVDSVTVCGNSVPDYHTWLLNQTHGVEFPDAIFDSPNLPVSKVAFRAKSYTVGGTFESEVSALQLGIQLPDHGKAPWPSSFATLTNVLDSDMDGHPGITIRVKTGSAYSLPPVNLFGTKQATSFYLVMRNVGATRGVWQSCTHMSGELTIEKIQGVTALNSHIIGCVKQDGSECTSSETMAVDIFKPRYEVNGQAIVDMYKLPANATCADVRKFQP